MKSKNFKTENYYIKIRKGKNIYAPLYILNSFQIELIYLFYLVEFVRSHYYSCFAKNNIAQSVSQPLYSAYDPSNLYFLKFFDQDSESLAAIYDIKIKSRTKNTIKNKVCVY